MNNNTQYTNRGFGENSTNSNQYSDNHGAEYSNNEQTQNRVYKTIKPRLPNSVAILTLGILSIVTLCCCGPTIGPILAIIAISLSVGAGREAKRNPTLYSTSSIGNFKAGKICAIIGLSIGGLIIILYVGGVVFDAAFNDNMKEAVYEIWNEMNY